jgi:hypothetical protein
MQRNPDHQNLDIDGRKVAKTQDYIRPPWYTDDGKSMDWSICKMSEGTPNKICRAGFQELVNEKYNDHTKFYTDGSKKLPQYRSYRQRGQRSGIY